MIIRVYYKDGGEARISVPKDGLIYDGKTFVSPIGAKWIALRWTEQVTSEKPRIYPVELGIAAPLTWDNLIVCKVIGVESETDALPYDTIGIADPTMGLCLCGITCIGSAIQNVQVFN